MVRAKYIFVALALVALNAFVYAPVRHFDFVQLDDPLYVTENPQVLHGLTADGVAWAFTADRAANWHPLTWVSHMVDVQMFGVAAGPHHVVNLVVHTINALLLFAMLSSATGAFWRSAFVAALFAVHPLHVESVAWIAERKDVLSTLFFMLTLLAYVRYARLAGANAPASKAYAAVAGFFALGLMAKPMLVTLPFVLLLLDWWPLRRLEGPIVRESESPRVDPERTNDVVGRALGAPKVGASTGSGRREHGRSREVERREPGRPDVGRGSAWPLVREKVPLFLLAAASGIITVVVQRRGGAMGDLERFPLGLRVENAVVSVVAYLRDMVWPSRLSPLYSFPDAVPAAQVVGSAAILAAVSFVAYRRARRSPYLLVGWLWYLGMLVPVAGLIQVGLQARADRYTYVPLIGIFVVVAWGTAELVAGREQRGTTRRASATPGDRRRTRTASRLQAALAVAAVSIVVGLAVVARGQVGCWKDNVTLFTRATMLTLNMDEYEAHMSLGTTLGNQGRLDEATRHFSDAVRLRPQSDEARVSLGLAFAKAGRREDALREYSEGLRLNPTNETARRAVAALSR